MGITVKNNAQAVHSRTNLQVRDGVFVWLWFIQVKTVNTLSEYRGTSELRQAH